MKSNNRSAAYLIALIASLFTIIAASPSSHAQQSLLWEVSGKGLKQPSYLFGTYHVLKSDYLEKLPAVQPALNRSQAVVVEMVIDSSQLFSMAMKMMMKTSLKTLVDSADYALLATEVQKYLNTNILMFNNLKPMALISGLTMAYIQEIMPELAQSEGTQLDMYFVSEAKKKDKKVIPLESMEEQMDILYSKTYSNQKQATMLVEMVKDKVKNLLSLKELTDFYKTQDLDGMWRKNQADTQSEEEKASMKVILDDRNANWMQVLPGIFKEQSTFVAVGALHLPGETGLISQLRKQGFKVRPVSQ